MFAPRARDPPSDPLHCQGDVRVRDIWHGEAADPGCCLRYWAGSFPQGLHGPAVVTFKVYISGQRCRVTDTIKRELRRRSTVEPVIGHVSRAPHGPKLSRWDPRTAAVIAARRLQLAPLNASRTGLFFPNTVFLSGHGGGRFRGAWQTDWTRSAGQNLTIQRRRRAILRARP